MKEKVKGDGSSEEDKVPTRCSKCQAIMGQLLFWILWGIIPFVFWPVFIILDVLFAVKSRRLADLCMSWPLLLIAMVLWPFPNVALWVAQLMTLLALLLAYGYRVMFLMYGYTDQCSSQMYKTSFGYHASDATFRYMEDYIQPYYKSSCFRRPKSYNRLSRVVFFASLAMSLVLQVQFISSLGGTSYAALAQTRKFEATSRNWLSGAVADLSTWFSRQGLAVLCSAWAIFFGLIYVLGLHMTQIPLRAGMLRLDPDWSDPVLQLSDAIQFFMTSKATSFWSCSPTGMSVLPSVPCRGWIHAVVAVFVTQVSLFFLSAFWNLRANDHAYPEIALFIDSADNDSLMMRETKTRVPSSRVSQSWALRARQGVVQILLPLVQYTVGGSVNCLIVVTILLTSCFCLRHILKRHGSNGNLMSMNVAWGVPWLCFLNLSLIWVALVTLMDMTLLAYMSGYHPTQIPLFIAGVPVMAMFIGILVYTCFIISRPFPRQPETTKTSHLMLE